MWYMFSTFECIGENERRIYCDPLPGVSITKNSLAVILRLTLSIQIASLISHVLLKNTIGKECIVVGCTRYTDKQLALEFHRLPNEEIRIKYIENFWAANNYYYCRGHFLSFFIILRRGGGWSPVNSWDICFK